MILRVLAASILSAAALAQSAPDPPKPAVIAAAAAPASEGLESARALFRKGKFDDAAAAFRLLVDKDPASAAAQAGLVRSLLQGHKLDEAEEAGKKALTALASSAAVHAAVGDVSFRAGKFSEAEAEYRSALKLDANSARAWFGMARMYDMVSMHQHAKQALAKAHELDGEDRQIYSRWQETLSYPEQLEAATKAAGEHPTEREQQELKYLSAVAQKKPWVLASATRAAEINMSPYGRSQAWVDSGNRVGLQAISKGFGLSVKFNDKASAVLLLDTGAGGISIGHRLAEKAGIVKIAESYFFGIGDQGVVDIYLGWADKIKIGEIEFHNCIVEVSSKNDVGDEAGLIGADVFQEFLITLDFKNWKLLLNPLPKNPAFSGSEDDVQDRYIAPEMQSFTKAWRFGHDLVLPVVVSDKAVGNFVLDTGSSFNSVTPKLAQQITKLTYEGYGVKGISGRVKEVLNGDKAILQFANMRVRSDDIPVFAIDNISNAEGTEIAGFIGIKTLVQMKMTLDYRDGLVDFQVYEFKKAHE